MIRFKNTILFAAVALASFSVMMIDQWLKQYSRIFFSLKTFSFYSLFGFQFSKNSGLAFGFHGVSFLMLLAASVFFLLIIGIFFIKSFLGKTLFLGWFQSMVFFGGISNFIDRVRFGWVVDYLTFLDFSRFNLADGMIIFGVVGWILLARKKDDKL